jgi:hypothetical protein
VTQEENMQREMHTREDNPRNPNQPERRRDDRRQQEQQPNEERRHQQRRESMGGQMAQGGQTAQGGPNKGSQEGSQMGRQDAMPPDSLPRQGGSHQKKTERRGADEKDNFGESYDRGLGDRRERHEGAGGKTDSTQRDMGRTGQGN